MDVQEHSTLREGLVTGMIGALIVAAYYFVVDTAAGQPFHTPNVLGKIFFRGDLTPGVRQIVPRVVVGYTVFHFFVFALVGVALALLAHLASRNPALRMGVWIGLVVAFGLFSGLTLMLSTATGERLSPWPVVTGSLVGVAAMAWYLWRRHPRLGQSFDRPPLGDEVEAPPHPPAGPRNA